MVPLLFLLIVVLSAAGYYYYLRRSGHRRMDGELSMRPTSKMLGRDVRDFAFWATNPILKKLIKRKITPTQLNFAGMVFGAFAGILFFHRIYDWGGLILLLSGLCDMLDGRLARKLEVASKVGAFLDSVMDRIGEVFAFVGMTLSSLNSGFQAIVLFAMGGSLLVSYTRAKAETFHVPVTSGFMQRPERFVIWVAVTLLAPLMRGVFNSYELWLGIGFAVIAFGAWTTVVHRIHVAVTSLRASNAQ
jgi:CDP-diacylglycerol--glycerol-3-phosphate 3-phosphatidyltransferase